MPLPLLVSIQPGGKGGWLSVVHRRSRNALLQKCMYVYIYIYICTHLATSISKAIDLDINLDLHVYIYSYMYIYMCKHMYVYIYTYMYIYMYVLLCVCIYTCTYTIIDIHACRDSRAALPSGFYELQDKLGRCQEYFVDLSAGPMAPSI